MPITKIAIFAAVVAITVGGATVALTQSKSTSLAHLSDGDVVMINSKTGGVHKSNTRMSEMSLAGRAGLTKGAKEISNDFIIYKEGGKLYMQNEANTLAAERSQMFENE
jgi:D-arabinose 5-phosphate isomerase GutQ